MCKNVRRCFGRWAAVNWIRKGGREMLVRIVKRTFSGAEYCPEQKVLKLGGEGSTGWRHWSLTCRRNGTAWR